MDIQNKINNKAATQNEQQLGQLNLIKVLLDIETQLKSIADNLNQINENGLDIFKKSWR